jgi:hypothetical protein
LILGGSLLPGSSAIVDFKGDALSVKAKKNRSGKKNPPVPSVS